MGNQVSEEIKIKRIALCLLKWDGYEQSEES